MSWGNNNNNNEMSWNNTNNNDISWSNTRNNNEMLWSNTNNNNSEMLWSRVNNIIEEEIRKNEKQIHFTLHKQKNLILKSFQNWQILSQQITQLTLMNRDDVVECDVSVNESSRPSVLLKKALERKKRNLSQHNVDYLIRHTLLLVSFLFLS
jgi:hypothetical protein